MPDRDDIRDAVHAWLTHQGYTTDDIARIEATTHESSGCYFDSNHYAWICEDEVTGELTHPEWDALNDAAELVLFLNEQGWRKVDPAADTRTEWAIHDHLDEVTSPVGQLNAEERTRMFAKHRPHISVRSREVITTPWREVEQ